MATHLNKQNTALRHISAKPLTYTRDDSPKFHQPGFEEPPDANGILALVVMIACCVIVGLVWTAVLFAR